MCSVCLEGDVGDHPADLPPLPWTLAPSPLFPLVQTLSEEEKKLFQLYGKLPAKKNPMNRMQVSTTGDPYRRPDRELTLRMRLSLLPFPSFRSESTLTRETMLSPRRASRRSRTSRLELRSPSQTRESHITSTRDEGKGGNELAPLTSSSYSPRTASPTPRLLPSTHTDRTARFRARPSRTRP